MTHSEALESNRAGLPASTCDGELRLVDNFEDRHLGAAGMEVEKIEVWDCTRCGTRIPIAERRGPLNAYVPQPPREMVRKLAEGLAMPK